MGVFAQSLELIKIIESHQWTLYDVSDIRAGSVLSLDELGVRDPVQQFRAGGNYFFAPIPLQGQSLRQAYVQAQVQPSLTVEDPADDRWLCLRLSRKPMGYVALFSRMIMKEDATAFTSPPVNYFPDPDLVVVRNELLVDTLNKYFKIFRAPEPPQIEIPLFPEKN